MQRSKISTLRIIGGTWRNRKISFVPAEGIRPTTDLARETLFNWLAPIIVDSCCLDLFAGSGALGFEALSRGAKHVVMVDASIKVIKKLKENAKLLHATNIAFYHLELPKRLHKIPNQSFDIVFLDPPFYCGLVQLICEKLSTSNYLAKNAVLYIKAEKKLDIETVIPRSWQILRRKTSGLASNYLLQTN